MIRRLSTVALLALGISWLPSPARATPIYALRSAHACDTCHIEPIGWKDPVERARKCSLDCATCHINRTGGGLRNASGRYYGREVLPTFSLEPRPSSYADPERYRNPGEDSTVGRYRLWEGFSGWHRKGTTEVSSIEDRYGDIAPQSVFRAGLDARVMAYLPVDEGADASVFPMQLDVHALVAPMDNWSFYTTFGLQGRKVRTLENTQEGDSFADYFTVRELVAEYDGVPMNGYVRAGRFTKPYGWRHPDHTIATRRPIGFDQYSQVFGVEAGINPNYPFANVAAFYQGIQGWPGERAAPGAGLSFLAGYRDLGWQVGMSGEYLALTEGDTNHRLTAGPHFGLNLYPVVYMGEVDIQWSSEGSRLGWFLYNELNYWVYRGVTALLGFESYRTDASAAETARSRLTFGAQWDIIEHLQLAAQYRLLFIPATKPDDEVLLWIHVWL